MPTLDRAGTRIHYEVHGDGPVVLLTTGYTATSRMWELQLAALSAQHRVITWDLRGHGESGSPDDPQAYTAAETLEDMRALLDEAGADRAVIGGHSMGGYLSLLFRLEYPERVRALMLFNTGPGFKKDGPRQSWNEMSSKRADQLEAGGLEALGSGAAVLGDNHRSARGLANAGRVMLVQRDARVIDSLPGIDVPTLVLVGERDRMFLAGSDYMASKIPGATKVVIPGAGHAANIHKTDEFNRATLDFLKAVGARVGARASKEEQA
ncbi:MAG: alpha/beta fold hydrolase [Deltaproteobacteria bacterium]|nr:alpha/beta fold hydrolase [Deltaproteobacteria bacterium]